MDLSRCRRLKELAENIGQCVPKLKKLEMSYYLNLRRLLYSISYVTDLEHLDLERCDELVIFLDEIKGLASLKQLNLNFCKKLQQLLAELGKLTNLETLRIFSCPMLCELPASIGGLKMLKTLDMRDSQETDLPVEFGLLTSITTLRLSRLSSVQGTFEGLQALTFLTLSKGSVDLGNFGALNTALKDLNLSRHVAATILPRSLGNLKWLVRLVLSSCLILWTVEVWPVGLEHLDLSDCPKLTVIPSLAPMRSLVHLDLCNCSSLRHVYVLECLTTLESIDISGCSLIEGRGIGVIENKALRRCRSNGSKVCVAYNNK